MILQLKNKKVACTCFLVPALILGFAVHSLAATAGKADKGCSSKFKLTNPAPISFKQEPVSIPISVLFPGAHLIDLIVTYDGKILDSQTDDSNFDGTADSIVFLMDIELQSSSIVSIESTKKKPDVKQRAHAEISLKSTLDKVDKKGEKVDSGKFVTQNHAVRNLKHIVNDGMYRFAGPLIESDKIAYRLYWAKHAAIDIYGKTGSVFVGDGHRSNANHHTIQPWGRDLLHNGKALGIGGLGIGRNIQRFSVGIAPHSEIILGSDGPIKASYRLIFRNLEYQGKIYDINWDISMFAGQHYLKHVVSVTKGSSLDLLAAMTNHTDDHKVTKAKSIDRSGQLDWVATYGDQCYPDSDKTLAQKSDELMGLALLWPNDQLVEFIEDDLEFEAVFRPTGVIEYYSLAVYNKEPGTGNRNSQEFFDNINALSKRLRNSLIIKQEK